MPSPNGFDYFRRGELFRNARAIKGYSLNYFRRGEFASAIAPESVTTVFTMDTAAATEFNIVTGSLFNADQSTLIQFNLVSGLLLSIDTASSVDLGASTFIIVSLDSGTFNDGQKGSSPFSASQNWDGVTAPSASITGWTVGSGWATTTTQKISSPNSISLPLTSTTETFLTNNTPDSNSGNVQHISSWYLNSNDRGQTICGHLRGSATPLDFSSTTQYLWQLVLDDSAGTWTVYFIKQISGSRTSLAGTVSWSAAPTTGWHQFIFSANGTSLTLAVIRASDGYYLNSSGSFVSTPSTAISITDSSITGSGYFGLSGRCNHFTRGTVVYTDDFSISGGTSGTPTPETTLVVIVATDSATETEFYSALFTALAFDTGSVTEYSRSSASLLSLDSATETEFGLTIGSVLGFEFATSAETWLAITSVFAADTGSVTSLESTSYVVISIDSASLLPEFVSGTSYTIVTAFDSASEVELSTLTGFILDSDLSTVGELYLTSRTVYSGDIGTSTDSSSTLVTILSIDSGSIWDVEWATFASGLTYRIYANDGAGGPINYTSPVATTTNLTWTTGTLVYAGDYRWAVRVYDAGSGLEEKNIDAAVELILDSTGADITNRPKAPVALRAFGLKAGHVRLEWNWPYGRDVAVAGFHVYQGTGGTPSYVTPVLTVAAQFGYPQYTCDIGPLTDGTTYTFGVRAYNGTAEEKNTDTVSITADASGPSAPTVISQGTKV